MLTVLKSGRLNLLEPSGPVQACKGIAFIYLYLLPISDPVWVILLCVRCHYLLQRQLSLKMYLHFSFDSEEAVLIHISYTARNSTE